MQQYNRLTRSIRAGLYGGMTAGALALTACGGGSSSDGGSGTFSLGVTDAPVDDAQSVYVEFSSVTLVPDDGDDSDDDTDADGGDASGDDTAEDDGDDGDDGTGLVTIELDENRRIDLLEQQNGKRELLIENESIPAGEYEQIRLGVVQEGTDIVIGGNEFDLTIPSGQQTGLKLNTGGLDLADGESLDLTIDFNLRQSVIEAPPGSYKLKPVLRLVEGDESGEIEVSVTGTYVSDECGSDQTKQAAYVFEGDVTPDDVDGTEPDPVSSVALDEQDEDGEFTGTAAYLEPGTYTVAFTCSPEDDQPPTDGDANDDDITFLDPAVIELEAGETASYELPPESDGT